MSSRNSQGEMNTPFRDVRNASSAQMLKRAWWIIALNFFIPGSAQVVAGRKGLGRIGIIFTLGFWGFLVLALLLALVSKAVSYTHLTLPTIYSV